MFYIVECKWPLLVGLQQRRGQFKGRLATSSLVHVTTVLQGLKSHVTTFIYYDVITCKYRQLTCRRWPIKL